MDSRTQTAFIPWALLTACCWTIVAFILRYLTSLGTPTHTVVGGMFGFAALFAAPFFFTRSHKGNSSGMLVAVLIGVVAYIANLFQVESIALAPNPGLTVSIVGVQAVVVSLLAVPLFQATLSLKKLTGVVLSLLGVIAMSV